MARKKKINKYENKSMALWLFGCAAMVFAMAIIGAITRLTESGLSMVEWKPLIGAIPPLSETEWNRVFSLYQQTPEYIHKNFGMNLEEFKNIFFWEWLHRLWGRLIGLVFLLPFLWFALIKKTPKEINIKLGIALLLGGLQGVIGWYMVVSGLADVPEVSHYRLALHLFTAFIIFAYLLWLALEIYGFKSHVEKGKEVKSILVGLVLVSLTIIWGAFVAGKDAGLIYNEFPKMGGTYIPHDMWAMAPAWLNIFENPSAIQFVHRLLAMITVVYLSYMALVRYKESRLFIALGVMALAQMSLGIVTLITQVHIHVAATHQAGAFIVSALLITICQQAKRK